MLGGDNKYNQKGFTGLLVYKNLYQAMMLVHEKLVLGLPSDEKYDLVAQMRRASKAGPAIIAEGWPKRLHSKMWRKYLTDALGECNEMIHHLYVCRDLYSDYIDTVILKEILRLYDISARQLAKLQQNWQTFPK